MSDSQSQDGSNNQLAGGNINNTTNHYSDELVSFDLVETEKMIDDLYEAARGMDNREKIPSGRMDISEKNKLNGMEKYFEEQMRPHIVYFKEIDLVLHSNENDFQERFVYIVETIRGAILAVDEKVELTPFKINKIFEKFYKKDWGWAKKTRAVRLIHYMYFDCAIGKKEVGN